MVAGTVSADGSNFVDFNGYFRAGTAQQRETGREACFQLAGAAAKYRLGNECDVYGEFMFGKDAWKATNGATFRANLMVNAWKPEVGGGTLNGTDMNINQLYIEGRDIPELNGAKAWMGRRFYKRRIVHITDFFYNSPTGTGFGLEDYRAFGGAKLSYAYLGNNGAGDSVGATRHNVQLNEIPLYAGGTLDFAINRVGGKANQPPVGSSNTGTSYLVEWTHKIGELGVCAAEPRPVIRLRGVNVKGG